MTPHHSTSDDGYAVAEAAANYVVGGDTASYDTAYHHGADYTQAATAHGAARHPASDYNDDVDGSFVVDEDGEGVTDSEQDGEGSEVFVSDRVMDGGSRVHVHTAGHSGHSGDSDDDIPPPPPTPGANSAAAVNVRRY